jgi:hypothetical protein
MMVKKPAAKKKGRQEIQGRAAGEDVSGSDFLEVIITAVVMAASVNPVSVRSPCLARSRSSAAMRFRASWLASSLGKRSQALLRATFIFATVRSSKSSVIIQMSFRKFRGAQPAFGAATSD